MTHRIQMLAVLALLVFFVPACSRPPVTISAERLANHFFARDPDVARKFEGKVWDVAGTVRSVAVTSDDGSPLPEPYLTLDAGNYWILCRFEVDTIDEFGELEEGNKVVVRGAFMGREDRHLTLSGCSLEEVEP